MRTRFLSTFSPYAELLRIRKARRFVIAGFIGRYPISMRALAVLLLVLATEGSYAVAAAVSSTVTLANALTAPMLGRLADVRSQSLVILTTMSVHVTGAVGLLALARLDAPIWTLFVAAAVFGSSALPLGSLVRARWAVLLRGSPRLQSAYALEALNDDIIYLSGPAIVTMLAANLFPAAGMVVVLAFILVGWPALALQKDTQPPTAFAPDRPRARAVSEPGMRALLVVVSILGAWLGSSNVSMIAFAEEQGNPGVGGVLIGLMILAGSVAGLLYGGTTWQVGLVPRLLGTAVVLGVGSLPLLLADSLWLMGLLALVAGIAITPMLVTMYSLLGNLVHKTSVTEGFAWIASSITVGSSAGTAASGYLVDRIGSTGSLLLVAGCGLVAPLVVLATRRLLARTPFTTESSDETPAEPLGVPTAGDG